MDGIEEGEYHFAKRATAHSVLMSVYTVSTHGLGAGVVSARVWARDDLDETADVRHGFRLSTDSTCFYDTALLIRVCKATSPDSQELPPLEPLWVEDAAHGGRGTFALSVSPVGLTAVDSTRICAHCSRGFEDGGLCKRCKSVRYCGKECQTAAWPAHKAACKRIEK